MRGNPIRPVRYMNDDDKIDRLRHAKYMHIDKASENIAAQHCCSIHYHRSLVLEGVRRAALRNIGSPNGEESQSIVDAGSVRLFSRKYNESVEVIEEDLNRICGDMFAIFMNSLWDVYLCLLYEELQAYRRLVKRNSGFGYAPLSAFMDANGDLLAHLREFRDRVLHPESRTSTSNALDGLLSSLDRKDQPFPKFVTEAQFLVDAHTVRFWHSMGSYFIREGDKEIASKALQSGRFGRIERLNRIAKGICHQPLPHWPNSSDLLGNPSQIGFAALGVIRNQKEYRDKDGTERANSYPDKTKLAKRGCVQMVMRALAFYNEFFSFVDVEKLSACPVDPSTDLSIDIEQFYRVDTIPKTVQDQENRKALLRVSLALLHEPLRLYKEAAQESPLLRVPKLDEFVRSDSKFGVLKALRKSVFHVPRDNLDADARDEQFESLSLSTLELFEPLMNFYGECPDPG